MEMYDITGKRIRSVTVGANILDIAVKQTGDVIVCNTDRKVRLVRVNDVVADLIETAPYSPQGVGLNEREEIVVCMAGMGDENHVAVYSPDGKKQLRRIVMKDNKGRQLLTDPYRVVVNGEYISVMNYGSNVVTCDEDGKVRWVYDGSQAVLGKLYATGMCVDKFCNFLISDWKNNCVHYVDRDGGLLQVILTEGKHGIEQPRGIGVDDETGTVWVGGGERYDGQVWIFRYLNTKRRRSDPVLWQKPLHHQKRRKGKVTTQTTSQKSSIKQRLRTYLGRPVILSDELRVECCDMNYFMIWHEQFYLVKKLKRLTKHMYTYCAFVNVFLPLYIPEML